jgi:hypothetical protein
LLLRLGAIVLNPAASGLGILLFPPKMHLTADFAYFVWHVIRGKFGFAIIIAKEELEPWDPKVKEASQKVGGRLAISTTTTKVCA